MSAETVVHLLLLPSLPCQSTIFSSTQHSLIHLSKPSPTPKRTRSFVFFAKHETEEALRCPAKSTKTPDGSGYVSLAKNLLQFQDLGQMPLELNLDRLNDGSGVEATLKSNNAQWHKTCRLKFNNKMLERQVRQRSAEEQQPGASTVHTRSAHSHAKQTELYVSSAMHQLA